MKACLWCGETMMVQPGLVERKKFCSKACMDSWWRGKRRSPGTEFKRANTPQTWVPVGTEAEMKGRYVKVKIAEPNVWRLRSHLAWEAHHGRKLPVGWVLRRLDGDPKNDDPRNLKAISRWKNLTMTLEDPEVLARARKAAGQALRKRWKRYRQEKAERGLPEFDGYYWDQQGD
jgi:hypothetical protein